MPEKKTYTELYLTGKPLTKKQLTLLIKKGRNSTMISLIDAHKKIRDSYKKP